MSLIGSEKEVLSYIRGCEVVKRYEFLEFCNINNIIKKIIIIEKNLKIENKLNK